MRERKEYEPGTVAAADGYITRVKEYLAQRIWKTPNFQERDRG